MHKQSLKPALQRRAPKAAKKSTKLTKKNQKRSFAAGNFKLPIYAHELAKEYTPGAADTIALQEACKTVRNETIEIPAIVNGKAYYSKNVARQVIPSDHKTVIANVHLATPDMIHEGIHAAVKAQKEWAAMPQEHRNSVFRRAADLIATKHRARMNAVTMIGTAKTPWQSEIDSIQEQCDFLRLNTNFAEELLNEQPPLHANGTWNRLRYRPLEGFTAALSPFNFAAIGTNLVSVPALMGNTTLWKPSVNAALENYVSFEILREAGVPDGVINFLPAEHDDFNKVVFSSKHFSALHFTGSTEVFSKLWSTIGNNLTHYKSYPRIVGETGGKNYHLVHPSADLKNAVQNTIRGAFEYQGQKCSACSRAYVPRSLWTNGFRDMLVEQVKSIKQGQPDDFGNFMSSVISEQAATKHRFFIEQARNSDDSQIIAGGNVDISQGYFVEPTVILTSNPNAPTMETELFGPVLTVYVYDDHAPHFWQDVCTLIDKTSPYALTGAVFSNDRAAIVAAEAALVNASGMFYINDKCTGAVVGSQAFGGGRASGTNDKAGSNNILRRFTNIQTIKENYAPLDDFRYTHLKQFNAM